jgi:hypothetical protein
MRIASRFALIGSVAVLIASLGQGVQAQPGPGGPGKGMMGPGMMMGPDMMRSWRGHRMCNPQSAGFAEWRMQRLEEVLKPTEAQRPKLDELKAASAKAAEIIRDQLIAAAEESFATLGRSSQSPIIYEVLD